MGHRRRPYGSSLDGRGVNGAGACRVHRQLHPGTLVTNIVCTVFGCRARLSVSLRPAGVGHGQAPLEVRRVVVVRPSKAPLETP